MIYTYLHYKYRMDYENNFFTRHLPLNAPWHHKTHCEGTNAREDVIVDYHSNVVCTVAPLRRHQTVEEYRAMIRTLEMAPVMLAALIEYAFALDSQGRLTEGLVELIEKAGGPDLHSRLTAPKVPAVHTPKIWDNVSQTLTDTVSRTRSSKPQRPLPKS